MAKAKSDGNGSHASVETPAPAAIHEEAAAPVEGEHEQNDMVATVATVAVVGIGAVAFEAALLPGIVLGADLLARPATGAVARHAARAAMAGRGIRLLRRVARRADTGHQSRGATTHVDHGDLR